MSTKQLIQKHSRLMLIFELENLTPRLANIQLEDSVGKSKMADKPVDKMEDQEGEMGQEITQIIETHDEEALDKQLEEEMAELERLEARERMAAKAKKLLDVKSQIAKKEDSCLRSRLGCHTSGQGKKAGPTTTAPG